jgi:hypothetical protein
MGVVQCVQGISYGETCRVCIQCNCVDAHEKMIVRPDYFHIGVGKCPTDEHWLSTNVNVYLGLKQLFSFADTEILLNIFNL